MTHRQCGLLSGQSTRCEPLRGAGWVAAGGLVFAPLMAGAKLVLPGPKLDGRSVYDLMTSQRVTCTAGVPTVWLNLLVPLLSVHSNQHRQTKLVPLNQQIVLVQILL